MRWRDLNDRGREKRKASSDDEDDDSGGDEDDEAIRRIERVVWAALHNAIACVLSELQSKEEEKNRPQTNINKNQQKKEQKMKRMMKTLDWNVIDEISRFLSF